MVHVKRFLIIVFCLMALLFTRCTHQSESVDNSENQNIDSGIKDTCLYRLINEHINNGHLNKSKYVFQMFVVSNTYDYTKLYLTYAQDIRSLIAAEPSGYFYVNSECILYYSGFDRFLSNHCFRVSQCNFGVKNIIWDINLPLHPSKINGPWYMGLEDAKATLLFTYDVKHKTWSKDIGNDIDILGSTMPQSKEPYWIKDTIDNEDRVRK